MVHVFIGVCGVFGIQTYVIPLECDFCCNITFFQAMTYRTTNDCDSTVEPDWVVARGISIKPNLHIYTWNFAVRCNRICACSNRKCRVRVVCCAICQHVAHIFEVWYGIFFFFKLELKSFEVRPHSLCNIRANFAMVRLGRCVPNQSSDEWICSEFKWECRIRMSFAVQESVRTVDFLSGSACLGSGFVSVQYAYSWSVRKMFRDLTAHIWQRVVYIVRSLRWTRSTMQTSCTLLKRTHTFCVRYAKY